MGLFSCCIDDNRNRRREKMPCTNCMTEYTRRRKEVGCSKCGFGFCERCVSHRCPIPGLSPDKPVSVCASCYQRLTGNDQQRREEESNRNSNPTSDHRGPKEREFPLPGQHPSSSSADSNPWGSDQLPPPSLRSLYAAQQQQKLTMAKSRNGGGGGETNDQWADLEERLARLNDPNQLDQPATDLSKGGKKAPEPKKVPAPPIEELEERLAALRGIPVELVRKPRLMVMNEDDDSTADEPMLNEEAIRLIRQAELGLGLPSSSSSTAPGQPGKNIRNGGEDGTQDNTGSESSSVIQNAISDALRAPSTKSSASDLSKESQLYPSFEECVRRTMEDAQAAEREAMEFIRRHEGQPGSEGHNKSSNNKFG